MSHAIAVHLGRGALAVALLSAFALAHAGEPAEISADIPQSAAAQRWTAPTHVNAPGLSGASVSDADVGDSDSFGRDLHWLGVSSMSVQLSADCSGVVPPDACQVLAPSPATTNFAFTDLGHIALPEKAANSLLCYWLSPVLNVTYNNTTAVPVVASLRISPTLTVENPVLSTPGLIDATTGLPFGGSLLAGMTSTQRFEVPLPAGLHVTERKRDSAVCIAGFLTRKALVETYGLSADQAKEFFKKPTTVRLNLSGNAHYVDNASLYFGFRIIGD